MKKIALLVTSCLLMAISACANNKRSQNNANETTKTEQAVQNITTSPTTASNYTIKTIDANINGVDILPAITKDFEGKVILIDFWATWCGPCRAAMKQLDTIKPELLKKGVIFIYVTGETSPLRNWEPMIKEIDGYHYRLTKQQWNSLCGQLGIPGIPAYMLLNKDGSLAYSNLSSGGYPGNDIIQNNIEVALTK